MSTATDSAATTGGSMQPQVITLLGSGNVATHLAQAFHAAGHQILQVWSRDFDHAEALASKVMAEPIDKLQLLYPTADVYVLAVSDDALFDLALDLHLREALVLHTSGSVGRIVLAPISRHNGVIWSPQTFVRDIPMDYATLPFCIEASSPAAEQRIRALLQPVSPAIYHVEGEGRQRLHLAATMVSNFSGALYAVAADLLQQYHLPFEVLQPLIVSTAGKVWHPPLWHTLTGPAVRRDSHTIDHQRALLADDAALLELYDLMTKLIMERTHRG